METMHHYKKLKVNLFAIVVVLCGFTVTSCSRSTDKAERKSINQKYNFLFIAIDDLNDWTGFLGGHPQTLTPNMDKLADESIVFEKAYCAASLCNPSRAALLTGYRPSSSGVYENENFMRESKLLENALTLPQWLSKNGYYTMARGKIFHHADGLWADPQSWDLHVNTEGNYGTTAEKKPGFKVNGMPRETTRSPSWDWGPTDGPVEETPDYLNVKWASEQLQKDYEKPFFLACGIYRPHLPWFVPQEFFDKFELDKLVLPEMNLNDYDDIPESGFKPSTTIDAIIKYDKRREGVQAYLASINYADMCVGILLDALSRSKYADNTIVILWGDNGWHLGEKLRFGKVTLWEEGIRIPLIIKVPGVTKPGVRCERTVNLIDLYPTITELAGVRHNAENDGRSIVPLLKNVNEEWSYPSVITMHEQVAYKHPLLDCTDAHVSCNP